MICGLLPVSEGKLNVAGYDLRKAAAVARSKIGYMSQKFSLYGQLSVIQNLDFFSSVYNLEGKRKKKRIQWALQAFSLKSFARVASEQLPLGFKQRLALACSLMHEPEILFLDEPTSGVDPMARREFWFQINGLAENQVTIMVTTHFMEEAEYCDRVALMMAGEIFAIGTPSEIKTLAAEKTKEPVQTMEDAFIALVAS
jgi:ABC-2 type transport system ATP-binding protein